MILGICGSPRKAATDHVLSYALEKLENNGFKTKCFSIRGKNIQPCMHCDYCLKHKECVRKDDMIPVYKMLKEAKAIIMATPVYNGGISSQLKAIMDRCRALGAEDINLLRGKTGMAIAVGGDRSGGQEPAIQQIHTYYILNGITVISGGSFGANLGATFWSKDKLEEVKKDEYGFKTLDMTLKNFVNYLNK